MFIDTILICFEGYICKFNIFRRIYMHLENFYGLMSKILKYLLLKVIYAINISSIFFEILPIAYCNLFPERENSLSYAIPRVSAYGCGTRGVDRSTWTSAQTDFVFVRSESLKREFLDVHSIFPSELT